MDVRRANAFPQKKTYFSQKSYLSSFSKKLSFELELLAGPMSLVLAATEQTPDTEIDFVLKQIILLCHRIGLVQSSCIPIVSECYFHHQTHNWTKVQTVQK